MARKKPYSGKKKKAQLQNKRNKNSGNGENSDVKRNPNLKLKAESEIIPAMNKYNLIFEKESKEEIELRKTRSREPIMHITDVEREIDIFDIYPSDLKIPKRPQWDYSTEKAELLLREEKYFRQYLSELKNSSWANELSYYEKNLETWRQLWRVIEKSDIFAFVADVRFAAFHFCVPLFKYINEELKKPVMLILNKIDAIPFEFVYMWKKYFEETFKGLKVVLFTSKPKPMKIIKETDNRKDVKERGILSKKCYPVNSKQSYGCTDILNVCEDVFKQKFDFEEWRKKINDDSNLYQDNNTDVENLEFDVDKSSTFDDLKKDYFTLGMVGFPNVGKSSVINALKGKKVVSVSRTPGHTKYFQTIFLTKNVCLCDCPGLVFPSLIEKQFQILAGIYPLAQLREPYTSVGLLAAQTDLPAILKLSRHEEIPDSVHENGEPMWSAWDICASWALKRGYLTAKTGRADVYRAANEILKLAVDGKIPVYMLPKNYSQKKDDLSVSDDFILTERNVSKLMNNLKLN